jgi:hypothetical protein
MFFNNLTVFFVLAVTDYKGVDSKFDIDKFKELKILSLELIIQDEMKSVSTRPCFLPLFGVAEEPIGDIVERVSLAVFVSQFLHFQRPLFSSTLTQTLTQQEYMLFILELRGTSFGKCRDVLHHIFYFRR